MIWFVAGWAVTITAVLILLGIAHVAMEADERAGYNENDN
jgi:hypothetical protein